MSSIVQLLQTRLPLNRKEVYFTATVLPGIICADNFANFDRFLKLLGTPEAAIQAAHSASANVQFFTEYCLADAVHGEEARSRFPGAPSSHERPDLMILIEGPEPVLIAVEAKLYSSTQESLLKRQMDEQKKQILDYLQGCWPHLRTIIHAALLPKAMKDGFSGLVLQDSEPSQSYKRKIITWEEIGDKYSDVGASYFVEMLRVAIGEYEHLKAEHMLKFGENADDSLPGHEILKLYEQDDSKYQMMGRRGGINGSELRHDLDSGAWSNQVYEVRESSEDIANSNWFRISDFIKKVRAVHKD